MRRDERFARASETKETSGGAYWETTMGEHKGVLHYVDGVLTVRHVEIDMI